MLLGELLLEITGLLEWLKSLDPWISAQLQDFYDAQWLNSWELIYLDVLRPLQLGWLIDKSFIQTDSAQRRTSKGRIASYSAIGNLSGWTKPCVIFISLGSSRSLYTSSKGDLRTRGPAASTRLDAYRRDTLTSASTTTIRAKGFSGLFDVIPFHFVYF